MFGEGGGGVDPASFSCVCVGLGGDTRYEVHNYMHEKETNEWVPWCTCIFVVQAQRGGL